MSVMLVKRSNASSEKYLSKNALSEFEGMSGSCLRLFRCRERLTTGGGT